VFSPLRLASHLLDLRPQGVTADMRDYYSVLGVGTNATKKEIRNAYLELAREWHPDHQVKKGQWIVVNEKFAEITEAYGVLTDDQKRVIYDKQLKQGVKVLQTHRTAAKTQAEKAFKNGVEYLRRKEYSSAHALFKAAVNLGGNVGKYQSYQGLAQAYTGYRVAEALELCRAAIKSELYNSDLYVNLAVVYQLAGRDADCKKYLTEALRWNAKDKRAADMLAEIRKKGGLLRRIFGKGD